MRFLLSRGLGFPLFIERLHLAIKFSSSREIANKQKEQINKYCQLCSYYQVRSVHSSSVCFKKPTPQERKKKERLIKFLPKIKDKADRREINVWKNITVQQLANAMGKDIDHVYELMLYTKNTGDYDSPDSVIDNVRVLQELVKKSGMKSILTQPPDSGGNEEIILTRAPLNPQTTIKRPPVVTIMGHVDHGKTTLLDNLRQSSIVDQEFGGITQHIGAFSVQVSSGEIVTFLDTPGHAAFAAMRARGASVTDIVVLVVAADDGVMEQTLQSIRYAEEAGVSIIVAINKIDKPGVNIDACKNDLLQAGIQLEDFGGDVQAVCISALEGTNLDKLVDAILTQAELLKLKGDPKGLVEGVVIESRVDATRGKLCTGLVQRGTLRKGTILVGGTAWAKVRVMFNEYGQIIQSASPSTPVEIIGWKELPNAGDEIFEVESERRARMIVDERVEKKKEEKIDKDYEAIQRKAHEHTRKYREERLERILEGRFRKRFTLRGKEVQERDNGPELLVILKGDVDGSVDAILDVFETYHSPACNLEVIHFGVGAVTLNDVELAADFKAVVYSFNTSVLAEAKGVAKTFNVPIKEYNIIYRLIDSIKEEINNRLPLKKEEQILGEGEIIQEYIVNEGKKKWPVAGSRCTKGVLQKSAKFRIQRGQEIIFEGSVTSMRHLKTEVKSINKNVECGLRFENPEIRFQPGDAIQCYEQVDVTQKIDWDPGF